MGAVVIATVGELVDAWQARWPRPDPATNKRNANAVRPFGIEHEHTLLADVDRTLARTVALANPGRARYLRAMFYDAHRDGLVAENPFAALRIGGPKSDPIIPPTVQELEALIEAAERAAPPLATLIPFSAYTGLRCGEARAVAIPDLVYEREEGYWSRGDPLRRVRVDWQITQDERLKRPKTGKTRVVMVPRAAHAAVLKRRRELYNHHSGCSRTKRHRAERLWNLPYSTWRRWWGATREVARVDCRWHDLRHFAATYFLDEGGSIEDTARQLGCSPHEIRERYGHPDAEKALARLEAAVL